jgi:large subunit ribosomal protein L4
MSIATFTATGAKASVAAKLPKEVFELEVTSHELVKAAYVAYLANGRQNNAQVKTRGEVSGGGRKPWRQKGTGRARFGSSRVPIWRGGGITHGPTGLENYSHNMSTGDKRVALRQALSLKTTAGSLIVIEALESKSGKTKDAAELFAKLGAARNTLVVTHADDAVFARSVRNIQDVKVVRVRGLNIFDTMNADRIILTSAAVNEIAEWLGSKS